MNLQPQLPSDGQLVVAAYNGMSEAWNELRRRHGRAVQGVARARSWAGAKKRAQRALEQLHGDIVAGGVPGDDQPGIRAVRPRAIAALTAGEYAPAPAEPGTESSTDAEMTLLASAFSMLPEPWQTALWHRWIELQPSAEFAPLLGRTANEATAVVQRAEAGLFDGFLREELNGPGVDTECASIVPLLGGSLRMTLSAHEQRLVDDHVEHRAGNDDGDDEDNASGCAVCRRRLAVGAALSSLLPLAIVPGLTGLSPVRYRAAVGARTRPAGAAAISEERTDRARRLAFIGAMAVVVLAVAAAVVLIRNPFDGDATLTTSVGPGTELTTVPVTTDETTTVPTTDAAAVTTTTLLDLRPPPTGPENRVELVFSPRDEAQGFAPAPVALAVGLSSPAPIFAGGTGTIDIAMTNESQSSVATEFVVKVPRGVELDAVVDGAAACVDPPDDSASCTAEVGAGETSVVALRFRLTSEVVGRFIVEGNLVEEDLVVAIDATPRLVHSSVDRGQIVMIGNTLMTCSESDSACRDARDGVGDTVDRWDLPAEPIDIAPELGWVNSSSAVLDIGTGSIEAAYLFWSGDLRERGVEILDDGSRERVSILGPNSSAPMEIVADRLRLGDVDATQYFGFADVTDLVTFSGPGTYVVGDVQSVEVQGSYAGWSLVVVTSDDSLPRRQLVVTSPFAWFSPDDSFRTTFPVPVGSDQVASLDVLAFEGERGFVPERLTADGVPFSGEAVFDSTIIGARSPEYVNNFGIDIDAYALSIDTPDGALVLEATSEKDGVRVSVLGLAVDLE